MTCTEWEEKIAAFVGGELLMAEVAEHLRNCGDCAALARALEGDRNALRARPAEVAEVDFEGIRREIRARIVREGQQRRWAPAAGLAAAVWIAVTMVPQPLKRPVRIAPAKPPDPVNRPVEALVRPRPRPTLHVASAASVEMRLTTADPSVIIVLVPAITENPNE